MLTINISFTPDVSSLNRDKFAKSLRKLFDDDFSHFDCPLKIVKFSDDTLFVCIDLSITFSIIFLDRVNELTCGNSGVFISSFNYNI